MKRKLNIRKIIKLFAILGMFLLVIGVLLITDIPTLLDSHTNKEDFQWKAWFYLFGYRLTMYFAFPFIIYLFELFIPSCRKLGFKKSIIENFNMQFLVYTIICAFYSVFGFDKYFGESIFSSSDSFMFIGSFILTLAIDKTLPDLFHEQID